MKTNRLVLVLALALAACETVVPKAVEVHHASIGAAGLANSGLVARLPGGAGYQIDATLRARYNALIERYGHEPLFQPPLVPDQGVTQDNDGNLTMDREAVRRMALLNSWRRSGRIPAKRPLIERLLPLRAPPPELRPPAPPPPRYEDEPLPTLRTLAGIGAPGSPNTPARSASRSDAGGDHRSPITPP